jgi:hypothetical protein
MPFMTVIIGVRRKIDGLSSYHFDLAIDSNDIPHFVYSSYNGDLNYAEWNGSSFNTHVIGSGGGYFPSLVYDSKGNPHISCLISGAVQYLFWDGLHWNEQFVGTTRNATIESQSLFLDSNDILILAI